MQLLEVGEDEEAHRRVHVLYHAEKLEHAFVHHGNLVDDHVKEFVAAMPMRARKHLYEATNSLCRCCSSASSRSRRSRAEPSASCTSASPAGTSGSCASARAR
eukprot:2351706-Pleurochrysis_carterae.AAC.1